MQEWWQNLPANISPIAFTIGHFSVRWYSLMYLVAFAVVYGLLKYRIWEIKSSKDSNRNVACKDSDDLFKMLEAELINFMIYLIAGLLIGARLGYVIFYDFSYYVDHLFEIFLPLQIIDGKIQVTGFYGLSYFGGLFGVMLAGWIFARRRRINFWQLSDFVVPAVPAGYFFGRLGNFLNSELYGRPTEVFWGMYFPSDSFPILRHPSQLYEGLLEGLLLFILLWSWRNQAWLRGKALAFYFLGYGLSRFFCEFFRQPDPQAILNTKLLTLGQIFSLFLAIISLMLIFKKPIFRLKD